MAFLSVWLAAAGALSDGEGEILFEKKIRPLLVARCYECHSAASKKLKAGLALDTRAGLRRGGETGPAVVPGKPGESLLLKALRHEDGLEMPPREKVPEAVVADVERWIVLGAPDPRSGGPTPARRGIDLESGRRFWSFQPLRPGAPPGVRDTGWPRSDVDRFILAALEARGLRPVGDAERRTLIRRATFDLIGLPPTPEEIDAFLDDDSPGAFERVVDRLLASSRFGERWGRHWLDVARYSESSGGTRNMIWPEAWRYRDWVIGAFNADLPYDRFVREQVAGDLMPGADPVATAFLALGPKSLDEMKREVFRMDLVDEQIDVISRAVLGLSVACARCHDHKFDPVPTRDYYAWAGIFRSTDTLYGRGPMGIRGVNDSDLLGIGPDVGKRTKAAREHVADVAEVIQLHGTARSDRYRVFRRVADAKRRLGLPGADRKTLEGDIARMERELQEWDVKIRALDAARRALIDARPPQPDWALGAREARTPEDCRIHVRGDTTQLADLVPRGMLQVLPIAVSPIEAGQSGRLQLAEWLTSPENPLTARVWVNRVWRHLFGRGLVATPDDFGVNGARASHPELLDHLAAGFLAKGCSTKRLIRELALSRTYRAAATFDATNHAADPENVLLWRRTPRRLDAESFRDAILSATGELDPTPMPGSMMAAFDRLKTPELTSYSPCIKPEDMDHRHRSVYLPVVRGVLPELFALFDFADPARAVGERDETMVPGQALFLFNSPWMIERGRALARRLSAESADDVSRIDRLHALALGRLPSDEERSRLLSHMASPAERRPPPKGKTSLTRGIEAWTDVAQAVLACAEFRFIE